jgi:hypothetical protein
MTKYNFMKVNDLYASNAYKRLLEVTETTEPVRYPKVHHVPAMIERVNVLGSDINAAATVLKEYFAMSDQEKDKVFTR